ncbi:MAG TPA: hypothetical protein VGE09_11270 [Pseudoxanthomonas sp.]
MSVNPRRLIREAAAAALVGKTRAGTRVESNRPNPLSQRPSPDGGKEELPGIIIYSKVTNSAVFDESPRRYRHEAELTVECALEVAAGQEMDDELDAFEQEAITALLLDDTLGGTADDLQLTGSTNTITDAGAKLLGAVIITFQATYFTYAPVEGSQELNDLGTVHTEHSLDGNQGDPADRAITHIEGLDQ